MRSLERIDILSLLRLIDSRDSGTIVNVWESVVSLVANLIALTILRGSSL